MGSDCDLFVMQDFDESSFPEGTSIAYGDFQQSVDARLNKKIQKFIVDDEKHRDQLRNRGFGEKEDSEYVLKSYESCI